jgi:hypothetical protein
MARAPSVRQRAPEAAGSSPAPARHRLVEQACEVLHDAYEQAAVNAGWETQERSRTRWADLPPANQQTMRAAVGALLDFLDDHPTPR